MKKKPKVSICIPTYNRGPKVYELVKSILIHKGDDIEVVVLDNLSCDNTYLLLSKIQDSRLVLITNKENIGGIKNLFKALISAKGEYCFLCLDKDRVNYEKIGNLINRLNITPDIIFGHCILNVFDDKPDVLFEKGFSSVFNMSYLSAHPSGMFYKTELFRNLSTLKEIFQENKKFGFYTELINAEMSLLGKSKIINLPLFYTETKEECGKVVSFTYTNENEVFFSPLKRFEEFLIYGKNLYSLNLPEISKNIILKKIFTNGLIASTLGYKSILDDCLVCNHYFVKSRKVSLTELIRIDLTFTKAFVKSDLPIGILFKIYLCIIANIKILYLVTRNMYK